MAEGSIFFRASLKFSFVTTRLSMISCGISSSISISGVILLSACIAASLQRDERSAPTKPWVTSAISLRLTSSSSGMPLVWIRRICFLPFLSGIPISISLSNLPPRRRASSMEFGRFVAAMTTTSPLDLSPSIRESSWATTLLSISPVTSPRLGAIESISSMKMMEGASFSASSKISLSFCSLSP
ncbi:hypothetical protein DSECCO2_622000 [anaerobic digester metagenome]